MLSDLKARAVKPGHKSAADLIVELNQPFRKWNEGITSYYTEQKRLEALAVPLGVGSTFGQRCHRLLAQFHRRCPQDDSYRDISKEMKKWEDSHAMADRNDEAVFNDLCEHLLKHDTERRFASGYNPDDDVEESEEQANSAIHAFMVDVSARNEELQARNAELQGELTALRQQQSSGGDDASSVSSASVLTRLSALEARATNDVDRRRRRPDRRNTPFRPRTLTAAEQPCPNYRRLGIQKKCPSANGGRCDAATDFTGRRSYIVQAALRHSEQAGSA